MRSFLFGAGLSILASLNMAHAQHVPALLSPDVLVEGRTQAEWSRSWWEWAGSFSMEKSPVADTTGALCGRGQSGNVWFLAGTYETHRTVRTCTIPKDRYLFFPLINYVVLPSADKAQRQDCAHAMQRAKALTGEPGVLMLDIDGVRTHDLLAYRQATPACFDMGARSKGHFKVFPSAANGYYVMLQPLTPGKHVLNFGGMLPSMVQAVTYHLDVR